MPIDFKSKKNQFTYTGRCADETWSAAMRSVVPQPAGLRVADIGCGGGIYSKAWLAFGAGSVIGVDSSSAMLSAAEQDCREF